MLETKYTGPLTAALSNNHASMPTYEWTAPDSLDYDITHALVDALDIDCQDFVLQEAIDTEALAKLIGAHPGSPAPTDALVSFRLESCGCTVLVDSDGRLQVWPL